MDPGAGLSTPAQLLGGCRAGYGPEGGWGGGKGQACPQHDTVLPITNERQNLAIVASGRGTECSLRRFRRVSVGSLHCGWGRGEAFSLRSLDGCGRGRTSADWRRNAASRISREEMELTRRGRTGGVSELQAGPDMAGPTRTWGRARVPCGSSAPEEPAVCGVAPGVPSSFPPLGECARMVGHHGSPSRYSPRAL